MADPKRQALLERLFAEQGSRLRTFFYRRVHQSADATELAQEVCLRMLRVPDISAIRNPEAYLFTVEKPCQGARHHRTQSAGRPRHR